MTGGAHWPLVGAGGGVELPGAAGASPQLAGLDEREEVTRVTLRQSNLEGGATDEDRANREDYEKNWSQLLDGLKKTAEH